MNYKKSPRIRVFRVFDAETISAKSVLTLTAEKKTVKREYPCASWMAYAPTDLEYATAIKVGFAKKQILRCCEEIFIEKWASGHYVVGFAFHVGSKKTIYTKD